MITPERKQELIEQEIVACRQLLEKHNQSGYFHKHNVSEFVHKCYENKQALIGQFDGWRWHVDVDMSQESLLVSREEAAACADITLYSYYNLIVVNNWDIFAQACAQRLAKEAVSIELRDKSDRFDMTDPSISPCACPQCTSNKSVVNVDKHIVVNIRKGQSIAKAMLAMIDKLDANALTRDVWHRFFEQLGQLWAREAEKVWGFTVSAAPSSFLRLGHYNEGGSCYRFGGEWQQSKGIIAQLPRSVVYLFYKDGEHVMSKEEVRKGAVAGRAWGAIGDDGHKGFVMTNGYIVPKQRREMIAKVAIAQMFGIKKEDWEFCDVDEDVLVGYKNRDDTYINGDMLSVSVADSFTSWLKEQQESVKCIVTNCESKKQEDETYSCNICGDGYNLDDLYSCYNCDNNMCSDHHVCDDIRGRSYCTNCAVATECEDCGVQATTNNLEFLTLEYGYACVDCLVLCDQCDGTLVNCNLKGCDKCELKMCSDCAKEHEATHVDAAAEEAVV